jgi:hypothetical protein
MQYPVRRVDQARTGRNDRSPGLRCAVRPAQRAHAVAFSWVDTVLDRPLGGRGIIRDDPDRLLTRSQPAPVAHDEVLPGRLVDTTESESNADADDATWSAWRPHLI